MDTSNRVGKAKCKRQWQCRAKVQDTLSERSLGHIIIWAIAIYFLLLFLYHPPLHMRWSSYSSFVLLCGYRLSRRDYVTNNVLAFYLQERVYSFALNCNSMLVELNASDCTSYTFHRPFLFAVLHSLYMKQDRDV